MRYYKDLIIQMSEGNSGRNNQGGARLDSEKSKDIRTSNIIAAKGILS